MIRVGSGGLVDVLTEIENVKKLTRSKKLTQETYSIHIILICLYAFETGIADIELSTYIPLN